MHEGGDAYIDQILKLIQLTDPYWDQDSGGFFLSRASNALPTALKPRFDEPNPSANARMIEVLAHIALITGNHRLADQARSTQEAFGGMKENAANYRPAAAFFATPFMTDEALQIVILSTDRAASDLKDIVLSTALPARTLVQIQPGQDLPKGHPARYKELVDGLDTAYVCRGSICSLPKVEAEELQRTLTTMRGPAFRSTSF